jgi:hypothetical protein
MENELVAVPSVGADKLRILIGHDPIPKKGSPDCLTGIPQLYDEFDKVRCSHYGHSRNGCLGCKVRKKIYLHKENFKKLSGISDRFFSFDRTTIRELKKSWFVFLKMENKKIERLNLELLQMLKIGVEINSVFKIVERLIKNELKASWYQGKMSVNFSPDYEKEEESLPKNTGKFFDVVNKKQKIFQKKINYSYIEIREPIISFLEQTGESELAKHIKELFS